MDRLDISAAHLAELVEALSRAHKQSGSAALTDFRMLKLESAAKEVKDILNSIAGPRS